MNAWTWFVSPLSPFTQYDSAPSQLRSSSHPISPTIEPQLNPPHSIVVSIFGILILSSIGGLFRSGHHSMMGSDEDPKDGKAAAGAIFGAVVVYAVFLVFCASQALLHVREKRRGAIALR